MIRTNLILLCLMAYIPVFSQVDTIANNIFENNGNLGIGTINPLSKLEVNGLIHSTSEGIKFPDGTIQTTATGSMTNCSLLTPSRIHIGDTSLFPAFSDGPVKILTTNN
ncbi:MAG: hypothetical protein JW723_07125, partial [Bacteroidales bacterium]|nr:hypothetical protein [Bacteroidales bacterium]